MDRTEAEQESDASSDEVTSLEHDIKKINRRISERSGYLIHIVETNDKADPELSCAHIVAATNNKERDSTTYEKMSDRLHNCEIHESIILKGSLQLLELYIKRARLRRSLIEETEKSKADVASAGNEVEHSPIRSASRWHHDDHYMMIYMERDNRSTFARLLPRRRHLFEEPISKDDDEEEVIQEDVEEQEQEERGDGQDVD